MENCRAILKMIKHKEDITWPRVDMNFISEWSTRYLTSERSEQVRYSVAIYPFNMSVVCNKHPALKLQNSTAQS